jgi:hypothetical protein
MPKADPKTDIRRARFQAYCRARGWFDEDRQRWAVTEIAHATLKPTNKVSDLLNGKGSFGAQIARELEAALDDMPDYYLDGLDAPAESKGGDGMKSSEGRKPAAPADDRERVAGYVIDVLEQYLQEIDADGRDIVSLTLAKLAKNPAGERERAVGILASAMNSAPPPSPEEPTPTKKARKSRASAKSSSKPKLELRVGGGQQRMFAIPVPPLRKIMRDKDASTREKEWYDQLPKVPKVRP